MENQRSGAVEPLIVDDSHGSNNLVNSSTQSVPELVSDRSNVIPKIGMDSAAQLSVQRPRNIVLEKLDTVVDEPVVQQ
ncbi:hypothetical protein ACOSP7_028577 [Xanthoceras sorbifolium]